MATIYVCLDDRNGMRFNRRRQSMDRAVLEDICRELPGPLTIDPFSEGLMQRFGIPYTLAEEELGEEAHFFVENRETREVLPLAEKIIIYRWNRHYPADAWWDLALMGQQFALTRTVDFSGNSHERLTKEVYER